MCSKQDYGGNYRLIEWFIHLYKTVKIAGFWRWKEVNTSEA